MSIITFAAEHWDDIAAVGGIVATLLWRRGKKLSLDDLWDTAEKIGLQVLPKLLADPHLHDDVYVRLKINGAIWAGLERLGVKHSKTIDKLVDEVTEHVKGDLAAKLMDQLLGKYIDVSKQTVETLKEATAS